MGGEKAAIIGLDFEKAFHRVERDYLSGARKTWISGNNNQLD